MEVYRRALESENAMRSNLAAIGSETAGSGGLARRYSIREGRPYARLAPVCLRYPAPPWVVEMLSTMPSRHYPQ